MEAIQNLLMNPFAMGFALGALFAFFIWRDGLTKRSVMRIELKKLRKELDSQNDHINRHLKINQKGVETLEQTVQKLREENINLKNVIGLYKQKPTAEEKRLNLLYDKTIRKLNEKVPGFGAAWENAFSEAEQEIADAENGISRLVKRAISVAPLSMGSMPVLLGSEGHGRHDDSSSGGKD